MEIRTKTRNQQEHHYDNFKKKNNNKKQTKVEWEVRWLYVRW